MAETGVQVSRTAARPVRYHANHMHGIIIFSDAGAQRFDQPSKPGATSLRPDERVESDPNIQINNVAPGSLGTIVRAFKSSSTLRFHQMRDGGKGPLWQRNYYEHIIRNNEDFLHIQGYIETNPNGGNTTRNTTIFIRNCLRENQAATSEGVII